MLLTSENVDVKSESLFSDQLCLKFIFKGKFTEEACRLSTKVWTTEFEQSPASSFVLIWDCVPMSGFEMSARREWVKCMQQLHERIHSIIVISDNVLIRGSARLMLKLFSFDSEVYTSYDELIKAHPTLDPSTA